MKGTWYLSKTSSHEWERFVMGKLVTLNPVKVGACMEVIDTDGLVLARSSRVQRVITIGSKMRVETLNTVLEFHRAW